jgi:ribonuclease HI
MGAEVKHLTLYTDGAAQGNPGPSGIGVVIKDESGTIKAEKSRYVGETTNNQAEYKALILGVEEVVKLGAEHVDIKLDSELLVKQIQGSYKVRDANLQALFWKVTQLLKGFKSSTLEHIPREQNAEADALAHQAIRRFLSYDR